jgi:hypothetical protein
MEYIWQRLQLCAKNPPDKMKEKTSQTPTSDLEDNIKIDLI